MKSLISQVTAGIAVVGILCGVGPAASAASRDTKPPSVRIAAPTVDQVASGTIQVNGSARDNVAVKRVAVSVDGGTLRTASGTSAWAAQVDTAAFPDGQHVLTVKAWDRRGNVRKVSVNANFSNGTTGDAKSLLTPEGTHIEIDSAGAWTTDQVYEMLKENGLDATVGSTLTVKVQDSYPSQAVVTPIQDADGRYTAFHATIYLQGVDSSSFVTQPDATVGHEFGHVWTLYHLYMTQQGDWSGYLKARGLEGDPRLESDYSWSRREIIADDYRLLFGSASAISERDGHLNQQIPDPRNVAGLRTYLQDVFGAPA